MSRFVYTPTRWPMQMELGVGWDPALETYFAQVMDHSISQNEDGVILWLGALLPHYRDIDELIRVLNQRLAGKLPEVSLARSRRARLIRERHFQDEDEAPHSTLAKDMLLPPVCVMESSTHCPTCKEVTPVYALVAAGHQSATDGMTINQGVLLQGVSYLPPAIRQSIRRRFPQFRFGQDNADAYPYLMNRCLRCKVAIADHALHRDWDAAFSIPEPGDGRRFRLFALPEMEDVPVYCLVPVFGIDDYPNIEAAEPW